MSPGERRERYEERLAVAGDRAEAALYYREVQGRGPVEGKTMWMVQYWDEGAYRELDGSRTLDLKEALKHRDRLKGKRDSAARDWPPPFRVRGVDDEPPLPW